MAFSGVLVDTDAVYIENTGGTTNTLPAINRPTTTEDYVLFFAEGISSSSNATMTGNPTGITFATLESRPGYSNGISYLVLGGNAVNAASISGITSYSSTSHAETLLLLRSNAIPNTPSNLNPAGTSSVPNVQATLTPTISWSFTDPDAGNSQSAYQVVIKEGTTVIHDTGKIASGSTSLIVPAGKLVPDKMYNYTVQTWDNYDAASPVSSAQYFKTTKAPVPTQTSPLGASGTPGGSNTAPTFTWDYFDADAHAQKSYQIRIKNTGGTLVHDTGVVMSANKSHTLATGILTAGATYYWELQVTDSTDMVSGFVGPQYFITNVPPPALIPIRPANTVRTITRPIFEATIGDDVENDSQHFVIQIADDAAFTTNLQERSTKTAVTGWEVKTASGAYVAMPASGAPSSYEGGSVKFKWQDDLVEGKTYYWRMAAIDGSTSTRGAYHATRSVRIGNVLQFRAKTPVTTSAPAERIVLTMQASVASDGVIPATLKVEAANNALDANPTWEDVTSKVNTGNYHDFVNKTKTAANWAVSYRVTINANDTLGLIEVQGLGISFD